MDFKIRKHGLTLAVVGPKQDVADLVADVERRIETNIDPLFASEPCSVTRVSAPLTMAHVIIVAFINVCDESLVEALLTPYENLEVAATMDTRDCNIKSTEFWEGRRLEEWAKFLG